MGAYKYFCCARDFGCDVTRTRGTSMKKHEIKCPVVEKFEKYLRLEKENKRLREEVRRLTKVKGRRPVKIWNVSVRDFASRFVKDQLLIAAWSKLSQGRLENAVPVLLKLFIASVPRFYKLAPCMKLVEVCGHFEELRTRGEIHVVELQKLTRALFYSMGQIIDMNMEVLGFEDNERTRKGLKLDFYDDVGCDRASAAFVRNALIQEVKRRRDHTPLRFNSVTVDLTPAKTKKSNAERPGGMLSL